MLAAYAFSRQLIQPCLLSSSSISLNADVSKVEFYERIRGLPYPCRTVRRTRTWSSIGNIPSNISMVLAASCSRRRLRFLLI